MRRALVITVVGAAAIVACVDLFHGTNFETLCDVAPEAAACRAPEDAQAPAPSLCANSSVEAKERAIRVCAHATSCTGGLGESAFGPCVVHALAAYDCSANPVFRPRGDVASYWTCLLGASTCGDVDRCIFGGDVPSCAAVTGRFTTCASASVLVACSGAVGRPAAATSCKPLGQACSRFDPSSATCAGIEGTACNVRRPTCVGTSVVACAFVGARSADLGTNCASFGDGTCVDDDAGVACAPQLDAGSCDGGLTPRCDVDGVARSCVGGRETAIDCNRLGLRCTADADAAVVAWDPLSACADRSETRCREDDACIGDRLRSCGGGVAFEADCRALGLGGCVKDDAGKSARCEGPR